MPEREELVGSDHVGSLIAIHKKLEKEIGALWKVEEKKDEPNEDVEEFKGWVEKLKERIDAIRPGFHLLTPNPSSDDPVKKSDAFPRAKERAVELAKEFVKLQKKLKGSEESQGMEVDVSSDVKKWCNTSSETPSLNKVTAEIRKYGIDSAGGVRHIKGKVYDVKCKKATDYRLVGEVRDGTFYLTAVYRHAKGGGKEFIDGDRISAYG